MPQNTPRGYSYPLYTDAHDFPAQMQDFATDVDTDVQNQVNTLADALAQPAARVTASAAQVVAANTDVTLTWALEVTDNANLFTLVAPTIFTVNELGLYLISVSGEWSGNADSTTSACGFRIQSSAGGVRARHEIRRGINSVPDTMATEVHVNTLHEITVVGETISVIARHNLPVASQVTEREFTITKISVDN